MFPRKFLFVFAVLIYAVLIFALFKTGIVQSRNSEVCREKMCVSFCCNGGTCSEKSLDVFKSSYMNEFYYGMKKISVQNNNLGCKLQAVEGNKREIYIGFVRII